MSLILNLLPHHTDRNRLVDFKTLYATYNQKIVELQGNTQGTMSSILYYYLLQSRSRWPGVLEEP